MEATFNPSYHAVQAHESCTKDTPGASKEPSIPPCDSGVDSGYASLNSTPAFRTRSAFDLTKAFGRKKRCLRSFDDISIPETTYQRFEDLHRQFAKLLYDFLRGSYPSLGDISIKLKVLGEARETAKPCVVIQCERKIAARVRSFFKKKEVKAHYEPCDQNLGFPSLEVFVHPHPPRLKAMFVEQDVWADGDPFLGRPDYPRTYESRIKTLAHDGSERIGTLGGLIQVSFGHEEMIYGLTIGHMFKNPSFSDDAQIVGMTDDDQQRKNVDDGEEDDDDDSVILDFDSSGRDYTGAEATLDAKHTSEPQITDEMKHENEILSPETGLSFAEDAVFSLPSMWIKLGRAVCVSSPSRGVGCGDDRDWALVELAPEVPMHRSSSPNPIPFSTSASPFRYNPHPPKPASGQLVKIFTASGFATEGWRTGYLGREYALLMLSSGNEFTMTYSLKFFDNGELRPGECGAWVVDAETDELYGHVVASDDFGEAYVVPIQQTFQDIEKSLGATAVGLPKKIKHHAVARCKDIVQGSSPSRRKGSIDGIDPEDLKQLSCFAAMMRSSTTSNSPVNSVPQLFSTENKPFGLDKHPTSLFEGESSTTTSMTTLCRGPYPSSPYPPPQVLNITDSGYNSGASSGCPSHAASPPFYEEMIITDDDRYGYACW